MYSCMHEVMKKDKEFFEEGYDDSDPYEDSIFRFVYRRTKKTSLCSARYYRLGPSEWKKCHKLE